MKLEINDIQRIVFDLYKYFVFNPTHKLPMRFIWLLIKILDSQLDGHPCMENDMEQIMVVNPSKTPEPTSPDD